MSTQITKQNKNKPHEATQNARRLCINLLNLFLNPFAKTKYEGCLLCLIIISLRRRDIVYTFFSQDFTFSNSFTPVIVLLSTCTLENDYSSASTRSHRHWPNKKFAVTSSRKVYLVLSDWWFWDELMGSTFQTLCSVHCRRPLGLWVLSSPGL